MERTDELKERIRQQPLNDRLEESRRRIGDMCSKGRCPKMTIPVQHDDDDFYINTTLADAQATIAALQARVQELEQWVQDQSTANLEKMRHMDEMQSRAMEAESQLTQRTAELTRVRKKLVETSLYLQQERANRDSLAACVDRDVKTIKELRTLVLALPKVEGEIAVKETEIDLAAMWGITVNGLFGEHSPLFDTKEEADAYAALLQHRQGMEG